MKTGTITISDELLCKALGLDSSTVIMGIKRADNFVSTDITVVHPGLPNLIEGAIPTPIQIEDIPYLSELPPEPDIVLPPDYVTGHERF